MRKTLIIIVGGLAFLAILYFAAIFSFSYYQLNKIATTRVGLTDDRPEKHELAYKTVSFPSTDGTKLAGWVLPAQNPKGLVLILHGFGLPKGGTGPGSDKPLGAKAGMLIYADFLIKGGYSVFLFDFRNQGESEGKKITFGKEETKDVNGAIEYIESRDDLKYLPLGLFGVSFGGPMAYLSAPNNPDIKSELTTGSYADFGLQLEEEVTSSKFKKIPLIVPISRLAARFVFGTPLNKISPKNYVGKISPTPIFIIHGEKDKRFSQEHPRLLFENAKEPKTLWIIPGGSHGVIGKDVETPDKQKEEYKKRVLEFFENTLH